MKTAPIQDSSEVSEGTRPNRNIFEDPAIQEAAKNDAFVRFITQNWRMLLVALLALTVGMIAYNTYTTTALNKRAVATARLADIQDSYKAIVDLQDSLEKLQVELAAATDKEKKKDFSEKIDKQSKDLSETRSKLSHVIDSLESPEPFGIVAQLYRGLLAGRFKDFEGVRKALASIPEWSSLADDKSSKRFVTETATLGLSKALAQSEADQQTAKDNLRMLAEKGSFVAVEAVATLSTIATTPDEKAAVRQLVEAVRARFPSQDKFLSDVAQRLS